MKIEYTKQGDYYIPNIVAYKCQYINEQKIKNKNVQN